MAYLLKDTNKIVKFIKKFLNIGELYSWQKARVADINTSGGFN